MHTRSTNHTHTHHTMPPTTLPASAAAAPGPRALLAATYLAAALTLPFVAPVLASRRVRADGSASVRYVALCCGIVAGVNAGKFC